MQPSGIYISEFRRNKFGYFAKVLRYRLDYTIIISNRLYYINRGNAQDMSTYSLEGPHIEYARIVEKKSDGSMTEYKYKNSFDLFYWTIRK